ncbi:type II toxin-antitoxin system VapC family toxin [Radicibacter daui]|uniref:type II toxin-antitoxin system VapC family toxin n=1 Tax=Radicibacter daui TaxID=3064829 RepID=UPI004046E501
MSGVILDASALLAMLREEPGGAEVAGVIHDAWISAVNYAEVVSHFVHAGMPAIEVDAMLRPLPFSILAADTETARLAGRLRALTSDAGLSLGDRFCLALSLQEGLPAWTADRQWGSIADRIGAKIFIIR